MSEWNIRRPPRPQDGNRYESCFYCGQVEIEPFTPGAFDAISHCSICELPVCSDCIEDVDLDPRGGQYIQCRACDEARKEQDAAV